MYKDWLIKLDEFKESIKRNTFELNGLVIKPHDGTKGTIEIKTGDKQRIFINEEQAHFIVRSILTIFPK